jgi:hypothetical protein
MKLGMNIMSAEAIEISAHFYFPPTANVQLRQLLLLNHHLCYLA